MNRWDATDVLALVMGGFWVGVLLGLAFLPGCESPISQSALSVRVVAATLDGWEAANLPEPPPECGLDWFGVAFPASEADYLSTCPPKSNACLYGRLAVIHPSQRGPVVERLAVHELAHLLSYCTLGDMDYDHEDVRVWRPAPDSAEAVAVGLLD